MNRFSKRLLFWSPRLLCMASAGFLGIFALDVFDEHLGLWRTLLALLLHLAPSLFLVLVLAAAWKRECIGAFAYLTFAVLYIAVVGRASPWRVSAIVAGPPMVVGILFLVNWFKHDELRTA